MADEKEFFDLMDQLNREELGMNVIKESEKFESISSITKAEGDALARIKTRTMSRIENAMGDTPLVTPKHTSITVVDSSRPRSRRYAVLIATAAAVIAVLVAASFSPSIQAELKRVLQFLPGFGVVQETDESQETFVLEKPYTQQLSRGKITIDAVMVNSAGVNVVLRGEVGTGPVKPLQLAVEIDGKRYKFYNHFASDAGDWYGSYSTEPNVHIPVKDTITLYMNHVAIGPIKLIPPKTASDIDHLGATDVHQEVRISAFATKLEHDQIRVQLVPQLPLQTMRIHDYGVSGPIIGELGSYVKDTDGAQASIIRTNSLRYPSDVTFQQTPSGAKTPYKVIIPVIEVSEYGVTSKLISIPLPAIGDTHSIDVSAELKGFQVRFTQIKRTSDKEVSLDVSIPDDPSQMSALLYFLIRYKDSEFNNSFSWQNTRETSRIMKTLHLEVEPGQDILQFSIVEPHYALKGPWVLPVEIE